MDGIYLFAVFVAAASSFLLGGLWYSDLLFGPAWRSASGIVPSTTEGAPKMHGHPAKVFGISFVLAVIAAFCFALLIGPKPALVNALQTSVIVGAGFVAASFGINYQFANRKLL